MFVGIANTPRDYAWGSRDAIASLLGREASGGPEAEYWLGTHPGSPSVILDPATAGGATNLTEIATLPFLLKVLAASAPLSLQAHPTPAQARDGFARENASGIALDAIDRNYKDEAHKPELIYALSDDFSALCGFRPVADTRSLLAPLAGDAAVDDLLGRLVDDSRLREVFEWLITRGDGVDALVARVVELVSADDRGVPEFQLVPRLAAAYPGDPGIVIALLLNLVELKPGEVLYLPAGNIHAYLGGVGIELMAASDNVLRGGLTPKHVDVPELLKVLDFRPLPVPYLVPSHPSAGVSVFQPDVPDFELVVIEPGDGGVEFSPAGEAILLCTGGAVKITGANGTAELSRGQSLFATADEPPLTFTGAGRVFLATSRGA
ncbi:MAG TPA: mannose-6-phosphate isomerase, class I [Galbitalea sp.]